MYQDQGFHAFAFTKKLEKKTAFTVDRYQLLLMCCVKKENSYIRNLVQDWQANSKTIKGNVSYQNLAET